MLENWLWLSLLDLLIYVLARLFERALRGCPLIARNDMVQIIQQSQFHRPFHVSWSTPQWLFDKLDREFGFDIDVCAEESNAKCLLYWSMKDDGLQQSWKGRRCWMNPPYGREISRWTEKALSESRRALVVGLLPARTDPGWFHDHILGHAEIRFLRGRLRFGEGPHNAPWGNMVVIWGLGSVSTIRFNWDKTKTRR